MKSLQRTQLFRVSNLLLVLFSASLALLPACSVERAGIDENAYRQEVEKWQDNRRKELSSDAGWLSLAGLFWLKEGENRMGSDASNAIQLPQGKSPLYAGSLWLEGGAVRLEAARDAGITQQGRSVQTLQLKSDADGEPIRRPDERQGNLRRWPLSLHAARERQRNGRPRFQQVL